DLGADDRARPRAVIDDDLLAQPLAQLLAHQARDRIGRAACSVRHDKAYRLGWIFGCGTDGGKQRDEQRYDVFHVGILSASTHTSVLRYATRTTPPLLTTFPGVTYGLLITDEQRAFVDTVREVCQKEFAPRAI